MRGQRRFLLVTLHTEVLPRIREKRKNEMVQKWWKLQISRNQNIGIWNGTAFFEFLMAKMMERYIESSFDLWTKHIRKKNVWGSCIPFPNVLSDSLWVCMSLLKILKLSKN